MVWHASLAALRLAVTGFVLYNPMMDALWAGRKGYAGMHATAGGNGAHCGFGAREGSGVGAFGGHEQG
jgi:hypothetical protein